LKGVWKKQAAAHNAALAPTNEERAEATAQEAEKAAAEREAEKASLMSRIGWLARSPDILTEAVQFLWDEGVAGQRSALIAVILFMAGRMHKTMPMALLRTGASASGKNFVVEKALSMNVQSPQFDCKNTAYGIIMQRVQVVHCPGFHQYLLCTGGDLTPWVGSSFPPATPCIGSGKRRLRTAHSRSGLRPETLLGFVIGT
jgi:hypothetical protein